jgi:AhpD family alkylhydroperoxidase
VSRFPIHTIDTAPEGSRETLRQVKASLGRIPNLAAGMAESPTLVRSFFTVREIRAQGTLSPAEAEVLSLANAYENGCTWCQAFHSFAAEKAGVPAEAIAALRRGDTPEDTRSRALVDLTRELIRNRGHAGEDTLRAFYAAGFVPAQALEVVLGAAFSLMANYAQHLIGAPLDPMLEPYRVEVGEGGSVRAGFQKYAV